MKNCLFETHRSHCVVSLIKTIHIYAANCTGSTQEDRKSSQHDWKNVDWNVKHQITNRWDLSD